MIFSLDNLLYQYKGNERFKLGPLSLQLSSGEITAVVGSNGSGKTTLIRILLHELTGYQGAYRIDQQPVNDITGSLLYRYGIGYAPEHSILDEMLTGYEILQIVREIHGINAANFEEQLTSFGKFLQLDSWFRDEPCRKYSQGMRKKVSLLIALTGASNYLVIDEPTNGLDPLAVYGMKKLVAMSREQGRGVLISSHVLDLVEKIADTIIILKQGTIAFAGKLEALQMQWPGKSLDEIYFTIFTGESAPELL